MGISKEMFRYPEWWVSYIEKSKTIDVDIPILCIPSHKRPDAITIKLASEDIRIKTYVFVYEDEVDDYIHWEVFKNIKIIPVTSKKGIANKRQFINDYMFNAGHTYIFQSDDDVKDFYYVGYNTRFNTNVVCPMYMFFKLLFLLSTRVHNINAAYAGTILSINQWKVKTYNRAYFSMFTFPTTIYLINLKLINENNICYDENYQDDFDIPFKCLEKGIHIQTHSLLSFDNNRYEYSRTKLNGGLFEEHKSENCKRLMNNIKEKWIRYYKDNIFNTHLLKKDFRQYKTIFSNTSSKKLF